MVIRKVEAFIALDGSLHFHEEDARVQDKLVYRKQLRDLLNDHMYWSDKDIDMNGVISEADQIVRLLQEIRSDD